MSLLEIFELFSVEMVTSAVSLFLSLTSRPRVH